MMKLSTNSALDYEYMDMLKHLFENTETQVVSILIFQSVVYHIARYECSSALDPSDHSQLCMHHTQQN